MWIQTYTGKRFDYDKVDPSQIDIVDIAHALSMQCRYAGHCIRFYSVAEHSVHMANEASAENKLAALLHDASEAYLVDIPRPLKVSLVGYKEREEELMLAIAEKYGFVWPMPPEVKFLDNSMLSDEREQNMSFMSESAVEWGAKYPALGVKLQYWTPSVAKARFLELFREL